MHYDWFILPLLLPTPTIWFSLDHKRRSHKRSQKKMETFWFFRIRFRRAHDSDDSDLWFSLSHKRSCDSVYDSDYDSVKTIFKWYNVGCPVIYSPACLLDVSAVHPLNLSSLCLLLLSIIVKESKSVNDWKRVLRKEKSHLVLKTLLTISDLAS